MTPRMPSSRTETRTTGAGLRSRTDREQASENGGAHQGAAETEVRTMPLSQMLDHQVPAEPGGETIPCRDYDAELWFAERPEDVEFAKTLTFSSSEGIPSVLRLRSFAEQFMGAR